MTVEEVLEGVVASLRGRFPDLGIDVRAAEVTERHSPKPLAVRFAWYLIDGGQEYSAGVEVSKVGGFDATDETSLADMLSETAENWRGHSLSEAAIVECERRELP